MSADFKSKVKSRIKSKGTTPERLVMSNFVGIRFLFAKHVANCLRSPNVFFELKTQVCIVYRWRFQARLVITAMEKQAKQTRQEQIAGNNVSYRRNLAMLPRDG